jgi:glyoxylase-like metal-dependent hydrolase (beta-lactamase superfamily II)
MFGGSGVIVGKNEIIIIDAQNRNDQADLMLELMQLYKLNPTNARHIILTHADSDHIGGLSQLKRVTGAKIVANSEEAKRIETPTQSEGFAAARAGPWEPCKVDVKVQRDMTFEAGDLSLELVLAPGHTAGSMCIYHKDSKSLFSGDVVVGTGSPYKTPFVRMDMDIMLNSLNKLNRFEIDWLLPGHGGIVHDGNKKITEAADELRRLPDRILSLLNEKTLTSLQISDTILVWPNTVDVALRKLEKEGKVRKVEEKTSVTSGRWMVS